MPDYYVNSRRQDNGDHEVHAAGCSHMPDRRNLIYLGDFNGCKPAVAAASQIYDQADGCAFCCEDCHTS